MPYMPRTSECTSTSSTPPLHMDYAGPFMGHMFLILIDAYSKWMDVYPVKSATSATTIDCLRQSFCSQGLPEMLVSDNGSCFVSAEFKEFTQKNSIRHITSAPYHASSNGCAERAVQTFKSMMKKVGEGRLSTKVSRVLFNYRITPQSTTGLSPAEMLLGRRLRSTLDQVHPDLRVRVERKQDTQKELHDKQVRGRSFQVGDMVITRNFSYGSKWIPGFIVKVTGPVSYKVMLGDGNVVRRHVDQILVRSVEEDSVGPGTTVPPRACMDPSEAWVMPEKVAGRQGGVSEGETQEGVRPSEADEEATKELREYVSPVRRSQRTVSKPSYLKDFVY
nr:uncharacterized protein K02A2.6-like [Paramormyrops kingsleyae]